MLDALIPRGASRRTLMLLAGTLLLAACGSDEPPASMVVGGDPRHGPSLVRQYGCGTCHTIKGVAGANGRVGPPLTGFGERVYIAGTVPNRPDMLVRWIMDPPALQPRTAMPNVGVTEADARHLAAYLYTVR